MSTPEINALLLAPEPGWNRANGEPGTVAYSFADDPGRMFGVTMPAGEWAPFSEAQKAGIRAALAAWADASGLAFVEVPDTLSPGDINMRFHLERLGTGGEEGFAGYPPGAHVYLNLPTLGASSFAAGTHGFRVAIHEIGHAIGLKHPFEGAAQLPAALLTAGNTVMSYDNTPVAGLGVFDIAVARHLYGANTVANGAAVTRSWDAAAQAVRHTGSAAGERIFGTSLDDIIDGGNGNDLLRGGIGIEETARNTSDYGADSMAGGAGDDTIESAFDIFGTDTINGGTGYDWLVIRSVNDVFDGLLGAVLDLRDGSLRRNTGSAPRTDIVFGIEGVRGTDGGDILTGLSFSTSGVVFRFAGGRGNDRITGFNADFNQADYRASTNGIVASLATGTVLDGVGGIDTLSRIRNIAGSATGGDSIEGGTFGDLVYGLGGADTLLGGAGGDRLDGGAGADSLVGGANDDLYWVDSALDRILEVAGGGRDKVIATVSLNLATEVEDLLLAGTAGLAANGNALANGITGNGAANRLYGDGGDDTLAGAAGNDTLDGGLGGDRLVGGPGDDMFMVNDPLDRVVELAGGGRDRVVAGIAFTLPGEVEDLTLGGALAINGAGNVLANLMTGNAAANRLDGGGGDDTLAGGPGFDTLVGGAGADRFVFAGPGQGADRILDFAAVDDTVALSRAGFGGLLPLGALDAGRFSGTGAATATGPKLVYTPATGLVRWDADGTGAGAAQNIASSRRSPR
ncbi:matrixin family metalloprotease [Roseomonas sp. PWR1]|uniref:Matrixin family metalloprotease n=1 Tax=Roseomonas nitratireducens TaxID=2820810 RepID=A0ABS4AM28_9PROT|nr:matrixin family metalloprotease [Neoroseomonas nitratireducens]MBP0462421.1 matrixin family metalloprotease [Neoroseomonas nitratireducens]